MEMRLKWSTLVLLAGAVAAAVAVSAQAPVILDETRRSVGVPLGSSVTLHCRMKTETHHRVRVAWYFNPTAFADSPKLYEEVVNKSAKTSAVASNETRRGLGDEEEDAGETLSKFTLPNAMEQNTGWYFCTVTVEIPLLHCVNSSGTQIIITTAPPDHFAPADLWMWISLGVSAVVLIVLLLVCVLLRRRRRSRAVEDPIYANTRPRRQSSPRPAMDHLKTVSSCENLRNPSPRRKHHEDKQRYKH